jgi:cell division protein FtsW
VIGEEIGFAGISFVLLCYGMIAYAGLQAARKAKDFYAKLLAAGVTSLILTQAVVNFFAVLGLLPLTGVPLPFISYGNSSLIVLLASMGLLCNVAQRGVPVEASGWRQRRQERKRHLRLVEEDSDKGKKRAADRGKKRTAAIRRLDDARAGAPRDAKDRDRSGRDGRARRAGARDRRRATG